MNPVVANQAQVPENITGEWCHAYSKALENPRNIKPTFSFANVRRFVWARYFEFLHVGNVVRIAQELKQLYKDEKLTAQDIHFFRRDVVRLCTFLSKEAMQEATHHTALTHIKNALAKLALSKPPILPEIRDTSYLYRAERARANGLPTPQERRETGAGAAGALVLNAGRLVPLEFLNILDLEPPLMPNFEHVKLLGQRLNSSKLEDVLRLFKELPLMPQLFLLEVIKEEYVDPIIHDIRENYLALSIRSDDDLQNGMSPAQVRHRFFAYLKINQNDPEVGRKYRKLIKALTPRADHNPIALPEPVAPAAPVRQLRNYRLPNIDFQSDVFKQQKERVGAELLNTVQRRLHATDNTAGIDLENFQIADYTQYLDLAVPAPYYNHVLKLAEKLDSRPLKQALRCFDSLKIFSQLYLLEVISEDRLDAFIQLIKRRYIQIARSEELIDGFTSEQMVNRFYAYVQLGTGDAALSQRYERLLQALTA